MSVRLFATRHSHSELFVHLVWTTKERQPLLGEAEIDALGAAMQSTARSRGAVLLAVGGVADHVHVLARYRPDMAVADLVRSIKASASHMLRGRLHREFSWQEGYAAFSISAGDVVGAESYILNQAEHHRNQTTFEEYEPNDG